MPCLFFLYSTREFLSLSLWCASLKSVFSLETFARISVTGFLLDPEIPISSLFTSPFTSSLEPPFPPSASGDPASTFSRQPSLLHSSSTPQIPMLSRGNSITDRLRRFRYNISRPFVLHHTVSLSRQRQLSSAGLSGRPRSSSRPRSDTARSTTPMMEKAAQMHEHIRNPSTPTFFSRALRSDNDALSLPFRLSVQKSHETTQRNLPYLRHSWTRIDFVAVMSFWITFGLAMAGDDMRNYGE